MTSPNARNASTAYAPTIASCHPARRSSTQLSERLMFARPVQDESVFVSRAVSSTSIAVRMYPATRSSAGIHAATVQLSPVLSRW